MLTLSLPNATVAECNLRKDIYQIRLSVAFELGLYCLSTCTSHYKDGNITHM